MGGGDLEEGCNMSVFFSLQLVTVTIEYLLAVIATRIVPSELILVRGTEENSRRGERGLVPLL